MHWTMVITPIKCCFNVCETMPNWYSVSIAPVWSCMNLRFKLAVRTFQVHYQVVLESDPQKIKKGVFGKQSGRGGNVHYGILEFNNCWINFLSPIESSAGSEYKSLRKIDLLDLRNIRSIWYGLTRLGDPSLIPSSSSQLLTLPYYKQWQAGRGWVLGMWPCCSTCY